MTPWLSCSTKSSKITNPQPWNWTLWWHLILTHPLTFFPPRATHTTALQGAIHIPVHPVCAHNTHVLTCSQTFSHPSTSPCLEFSIPLTAASWDQPHNLTGPAWILPVGTYIARGKWDQQLDLVLSLSSGIRSHCNWQPRRAQWQTSTCFQGSRPQQSSRHCNLFTSFSWV